MRYASKQELLSSIEAEHDALVDAVRGIPESRYTEPDVWGYGWTIGGLLAHLAEWHHLFRTWFEEGSRGSRSQMPAPGYKWNEPPRLNRAIWEKHRGRPFSNVAAEFASTYQAVLDLLGALSEEDILEPGRFPWTGKNPLATYVGPNTASHDRFAQKMLRRWLRSTGGG